MELVVGLLARHKYLAMFGVLFLCGLGLPIPEEVTLLASGLAVGWGDANFWLASLACVAGILAGDSIIFFLGRHYGRRLMTHRVTRGIFTRRRQAKARSLFARHRSKTVFFARFFAGLRIVVYAYAGQHRMSWSRFLLLDLAGALLSGPTSIAVGWYATTLASREDAHKFAHDLFDTGRHWIYTAVLVFVIFLLVRWFWRIRREKAHDGTSSKPPRSEATARAPERGKSLAETDPGE